MKARLVKFGEIEVEGKRYTHDVVIDGGKVRKRKGICETFAGVDLILFELWRRFGSRCARAAELSHPRVKQDDIEHENSAAEHYRAFVIPL